MSATELFSALFRVVKIDDFRWWPAFGEFEVVAGAILIQNTSWKNADLVLENLRAHGLLSVQVLADISQDELAEIIKQSGFYNQKAKRLRSLCAGILEEFGDFESFAQNVSREWLISRKGIGAETCDAMLCYACRRAQMVADSYSARLLGALGYEFESYDELAEWLGSLDFGEIFELVNGKKSGGVNDANPQILDDENGVYALFHGLIVDFCKEHLCGKVFDEYAQELFRILK